MLWTIMTMLLVLQLFLNFVLRHGNQYQQQQRFKPVKIKKYTAVEFHPWNINTVLVECLFDRKKKTENILCR